MRRHRTVAFYVRGVEFCGKGVAELRATRDRLIAAGGTSVRSPAVDDMIVPDKAPPVLRRLARGVTSTFGQCFTAGEKVWTVPCFGGRAPLFYNVVRVQCAKGRMIQVSTVIGDLPANTFVDDKVEPAKTRRTRR